MLVGVECEVAGLSRQSLHDALSRTVSKSFRWELHDDGSIRRQNYSIANTSIIPISVYGSSYLPIGASPTDRYGPEVVSGPMKRDDILKFCEEVTAALYKIPASPRSSIHVHVSGFKGWQHIKNLILWMYHLEAPMFRISALGGRHRGEMAYDGVPNDYKYCRPLSSPIGICDDGGRAVPLVNMERLIESKSFGELLAAWGRLDFLMANEGLHHYCPHRLHSIQPCNLLNNGTMEFRLWNGVVKYLVDFVYLSIRLFELAKEGPPQFEPMLLGSKSLTASAGDISIILGVDIQHLWGERWCEAPEIPKLLSHYTHNTVIPSSSMRVHDLRWNRE